MGFNLMQALSTVNLSNLILHQIFLLYGISANILSTSCVRSVAIYDLESWVFCSKLNGLENQKCFIANQKFTVKLQKNSHFTVKDS